MLMRIALVVLMSSTALAQGKVSQRRSGSDCTSGDLRAGPLRLCNLSGALSSVPQVFVDGHFDQLDFRKSPDETQGLGWVGVAKQKDGPLVVGVLDWHVESSGEELVLVTTTDAGKTWQQLPAVKKPHYLASFRSLELKSARHWILKIVLDDCADCGVAKGTRVYETHDAGAHWSLR